jgi:CRP/FNR family transcriptional regulator, cyclic AMP receptor protein
MLRHQDPKLEMLSRIDVLSGSTRHELQEICRLTTQLTLSADRILCRQGEEAREVFLLADGQVAVTRDDVPVGIVMAGGIVGEMGVVDMGPRTATAMALTDVTVFVLSTGEFASLLAQHPTVAANVRALVAARAEENETLWAA